MRRLGEAGLVKVDMKPLGVCSVIYTECYLQRVPCGLKGMVNIVVSRILKI
jgi:hypothetical protein